MTEQFHWTSKAGVKIVVPRMKSISSGLIRKHRKLDSADFIYTLLEAVASEDALEATDALSAEEMNKFFEAWEKDEGASMGESSGSST